VLCTSSSLSVDRKKERTTSKEVIYACEKSFSNQRHCHSPKQVFPICQRHTEDGLYTGEEPRQVFSRIPSFGLRGTNPQQEEANVSVGCGDKK
jgi:hypothetical protein